MAESDRVRGRVAVITGAPSGIGTDLARKALSLDMRLVLADLQTERLKALAGTLPGQVLAVLASMTSALPSNS